MNPTTQSALNAALKEAMNLISDTVELDLTQRMVIKADIKNAFVEPFNVLTDRIAELEKALEPFAAMHREGSDPDELACERGTASDMTILTSHNFAEAAEVLGK